jgi:hypothetical protein
LPPGCREGGGEQTRGNPLPPQREVDVSAEHTDMIEGTRVGRKRLHALEADDCRRCRMLRHQKHAAFRKGLEVAPLGADCERRVERGERARFDDGIEDRRH